MKTKFIAPLVAAFILSSLGGCQDANKASQTESQRVRQLKIEKTQLVQEFQEKEKALNEEIADLKSQISKRDLAIREYEKKEKGMAEVVSRIMEQMKEQQKRIDALEAAKHSQAQTTETPAKIEAKPQQQPTDAKTENSDISAKLEKLKQLQKKAAQEKK